MYGRLDLGLDKARLVVDLVADQDEKILVFRCPTRMSSSII